MNEEKYVKIEEPKYDDPVISYLINLRTARGKEHITVQRRKQSIQSLIDLADAGLMTQQMYDIIKHRFAKPPRASQPFIDRQKKALDAYLETVVRNLELKPEEAEELKRLYYERGLNSPDIPNFYRAYLDRMKPFVRKSHYNELEILLSRGYFNVFSSKISATVEIAKGMISHYLSLRQEDREEYQKALKEKDNFSLLSLARKYRRMAILQRAILVLKQVYLTNALFVKRLTDSQDGILSDKEIDAIAKQEPLESAYQQMKDLEREITPRGSEALFSKDKKGSPKLDFRTIEGFRSGLGNLEQEIKVLETEIEDFNQTKN